jgi:hypothetical protein
MLLRTVAGSIAGGWYAEPSKNGVAEAVGVVRKVEATPFCLAEISPEGSAEVEVPDAAGIGLCRSAEGDAGAIASAPGVPVGGPPRRTSK